METKKSMFTPFIRGIAIVLTVLTVAYLLPMTVFGEMIAENTSQGSSEQASANDEAGVGSVAEELLKGQSYFSPEGETEAFPIGEDTALRDSNVKQFLMSDGSYTLAVYPSSVHYKDEYGQWQDIDNTLSESGSGYESPNARIKFAKKIPGNEGIFTLHEHNRKITVSLMGAVKKTEGAVTNRQTEHGEDATELQKMMTLDKLNSSIIYKDILPDTDLEYVICGMNIKENIIVKARADEYVYSFALALNNLTAELVDGRVELRDGGKLVYTVPAPFMLDAAGERSDNVTYTLTDSGNGKYILTVTADKEWINSPERAFPVTVDPAIVTEQELAVNIETASVSYDLHVGASSVLKHDNRLLVGHAEFEREYRGFISIDNLNIITRSAYIQEATLELRQKNFYIYYEGYTPTTEELEAANMDINLSPCQDFDIQELSWNNQPSTYGSSIPIDGSTHATTIDYTWDISEHLRYLLDYNYSSTNFRLSSYRLDNGMTEIYNREFYTETSNYVPTIRVKYKEYTGVEDYWSTTDHSAGFAGSGKVNNRTGDLCFSLDALSTIDHLLPIGTQLIYNGTYSGEYVTSINSALPYTTVMAPRGFKLNLQQTITSVASNGYRFLLTDADGTEHWFLPTTLQYIYRDIDGLSLTLNCESVSPNVVNPFITVTDGNGTVYTYSQILYNSFVLTSIKDQSGNTVTIELDSEYRPKSLKLLPNGYTTTITALEFFYNDSGLIKRIYNPNTCQAYIFLYSNGYNGTSFSQNNGDYLRYALYAVGTLSAPEYTEGTPPATTALDWDALSLSDTPANISVYATAEYSYNSSGQLLLARDILHDQEIRYTYSSEGRVVSVKEYAGENSLGQQYGFTYNPYNTKVRTSGSDDIYGTTDDHYTIYVFDQFGRTDICYVTNLQGTERYSYETYDYSNQEFSANSLYSVTTTLGSYSNYLLDGGFESSSVFQYWERSTDTIFRSDSIVYNGEWSICLLRNESVSQSVTLYPGTYTLSFYVATNCYDSKLSVSYLDFNDDIILRDTSGHFSSYSYTFDLTTTQTLCFSFEISEVTQTSASPIPQTYIDDIMLARSDTAKELDLVMEGHFENTSDNVSPWGNAVIVSEAGSYNSYLKLGAGSVQNVSYTVLERNYTNITSDAVEYTYRSMPPTYYTVSADAITYANIGKGNLFRIEISVDYATYTGEPYSKTYYLDFRSAVNTWLTNSITVSENNMIGKIKKITLTLRYAGNAYAYFDNVSVVERSDNITLCVYNEYGTPFQVITRSSTVYYTYNQKGELLAEVNSDGHFSIYEYDSKSRVKNVASFSFEGEYIPKAAVLEIVYDTVEPTEINTDIGSVVGECIYGDLFTEYSYDSLGNIVSTKTSELTVNNGSRSILLNLSYANNVTVSRMRTVSCAGSQSFFRVEPEEGANYFVTYTQYETTEGSPILGAVKNQTQGNDEVTQYYYDSFGRVKAVIGPNNTGTSYEYDALGNLRLLLPVKVSSQAAEEGYTEINQSASIVYDYSEETDLLDRIVTPTTVYSFNYDVYGSVTEVSQNGIKLETYTHNSYNGKLKRVTYGDTNGDGMGEYSINYTYDHLERLVAVNMTVLVEELVTFYDEFGNAMYEYLDYYEELIPVYEYVYSSDGKLLSYIDRRLSQSAEDDTETKLHYDTSGRLILSTVNDGQRYAETETRYRKDGRIRLTSLGITHSNYPTYVSLNLYYYNPDDTVDRVTMLNGSTETDQGFEYDVFGRTTETSQEIDIGRNGETELNITQSYEYEEEQGGKQLSRISEVTYSINQTEKSTSYEYYADGNIKSITSGGKTTDYVYDDFGQLIRENNQSLGKTYVWTYDSAGNILTKKTYAYTTAENLTNEISVDTYGYQANSDRLISYKQGTNTTKYITYNAIGAPTSYKGLDIKWTGNLLSEYGNWEFTHKADGLVTARSRIDYQDEYVEYRTTYHYIWDGNTVAAMEFSDDQFRYTAQYFYDPSGAPFMMYYEGYMYSTAAPENGYYFYETNLQGDIVAIYDSNGAKVLSFTYDAWGNFTQSYTGVDSGAYLADYFVNATLFRYRGYIYENETGLYYLQTRYYDPEIGRFISPDSTKYLDPESINGLNLYAYCLNNPIIYSDPTGHSATLAIILGIVAIVGLITTGIGVATDNNIVTAIGLTMVAVPAIISGVGALFSGATYLSIVGGATAFAGIGTGIFASSEYQEAFTGNNWMLDAGMREEWYNGLMITIATLATAGTIATGVLTSIGNAATPNQMMNSFQNNPNRWKTVKELVEPGKGKYKGGTSTYSNYIHEWTGSRLGIHKIIKGVKFIHGPHFHPWI